MVSYVTITTNAIGRLTFFTTIRSTLEVLYFVSIAGDDDDCVLDRRLSHRRRRRRRHWRELAARYICRGEDLYTALASKLGNLLAKPAALSKPGNGITAGQVPHGVDVRDVQQNDLVSKKLLGTDGV
jgi:hypothetical protein